MYETAHAENGEVMWSSTIEDEEGNKAKVGGWMLNQRRAKRLRTISQERIERCEQLPGWSWGKDA